MEIAGSPIGSSFRWRDLPPIPKAEKHPVRTTTKWYEYDFIAKDRMPGVGNYMWVSVDGGTPKWMVYDGTCLSKMDDLG